MVVAMLVVMALVAIMVAMLVVMVGGYAVVTMMAVAMQWQR